MPLRFVHNSFSAEEEHFIIYLKEVVGGLNWDDLAFRYAERFPDNPRSKGGLQVHYSRSLQPGRDRRPDDLPSSSKLKKATRGAKLKAELKIKDSDDDEEDFAINPTSEAGRSQSDSKIIKLKMRVKRELPRSQQRPRRAVTAAIKNYAEYRRDSLSPFEVSDSFMPESLNEENHIDEITESPEHAAAKVLLGLSSPNGQITRDVTKQDEVIESVEVDDMPPPPVPSERLASSSPLQSDEVEQSTASQTRQEEILRSKRSYGKSPSLTFVRHQGRESRSERETDISFDGNNSVLDINPSTVRRPAEPIRSLKTGPVVDSSGLDSPGSSTAQEAHDTPMGTVSDEIDALYTGHIHRTKGIKLNFAALTASKTKSALPAVLKPQPAGVKKNARVRKAPARLIQHVEDDQGPVEAVEGIIAIVFCLFPPILTQRPGWIPADMDYLREHRSEGAPAMFLNPPATRIVEYNTRSGAYRIRCKKPALAAMAN
jgi:hypothetical protein